MRISDKSALVLQVRGLPTSEGKAGSRYFYMHDTFGYWQLLDIVISREYTTKYTGDAWFEIEANGYTGMKKMTDKDAGVLLEVV